MPSKPPSEVDRPEPAVGQVWRNMEGLEFWIFEQHRNEFRYIDSSGDVSSLIPSHAIVLPSDTYVGEFGGFKIREEK